jgi:PQQ-dependent catabolism-associated beta-propeller protein
MHAGRLLLVALLAVGAVTNPAAGEQGQKAQPRAFVSNEFGGDITVIDVATDRISGRLPVGPVGVARPRGMALSRDRQTVYVAVTDPTYGQSEGGRQWQFILAIDVATAHIKGKYRCGTDPERLDVTPDGRRIYCSNEDAAEATALDVANGKVVATVRTGIEPEGVGISPDGRWVYVTAETSNTVTIIDAKTNKPVKNVLVGDRPRFVVFASDGRRAYVSSEIGGTLAIIDAATLTVTKSVLLDPGSKPVGVAVAPDDNPIYVVGGRCNCLFAVDLHTFKVSTVTRRMGRRPWGVAVTSDGKRIYTANGRSDDVSVIDATTLQVVHTIANVGRGPHSIVISR